MDGSEDVKVSVEAFSDQDKERATRCPRCRKWHYVHLNYDGLCDRCCEVLLALPDDLNFGQGKLGPIKQKIHESIELQCQIWSIP